MFNYILQYLFLLTPLAAHLAHDTVEINHGESPQHGRNLVILFILSLVFGWLVSRWAVPHITICQYILYVTAIHFAFFNYLLNFFRVPRKPLFYLGEGPFDTILKKCTTPGMIAVQIIILVLGFTFYHGYWR